MFFDGYYTYRGYIVKRRDFLLAIMGFVMQYQVTQQQSRLVSECLTRRCK